MTNHGLFLQHPHVQAYYEQVTSGLRRELERGRIEEFLALDEETFVEQHRSTYELPHLAIDSIRGGYQFEEPEPLSRTGVPAVGTLRVFLKPHHLNARALQLGADGTWMETTDLRTHGHFDDDIQAILVQVRPERLGRVHEAIQQNIETLNKALDHWGPRFAEQLHEVFRIRRDEIESAEEKDRALRRATEAAAAKLGIGLRRRDNPVEPVNVRPPAKVQLLRQVLRESRQDSERRLAPGEIQQIVAVINQAGQGFETAPTVFNKLDEPDLSVIMAGYLNAVFIAEVATRETFVKGGKTDIHVRVGDRQDSVLVVECKVWHGRQAYADAIDQLWSYVTLRHSVAILSTFSRNQALSEVLDEARSALREHPSFLEGPEAIDETHLRSIHAHPDDRRRELELHHLFFNLYVSPSIEAARRARRR